MTRGRNHSEEKALVAGVRWTNRTVSNKSVAVMGGVDMVVTVIKTSNEAG